MLRNYLLTAWKVFMRRKLFTAINLVCIVLTLVVLMVVTSLLETAFRPSGVEGKSDRFLQIVMMRLDSPDGHRVSTMPLGFKLIEKYLKPMPGVERVAAVTLPTGAAVYQGERVSELQMRRADADYWKILDFTLLAGRLPNAADGRHEPRAAQAAERCRRAGDRTWADRRGMGGAWLSGPQGEPFTHCAGELPQAGKPKRPGHRRGRRQSGRD